MSNEFFGRVEVFDSDTGRRLRFLLDTDKAALVVGGNDNDGDILLFRRSARFDELDTDQATIWLDGQAANAILGGSGADGDLLLFPGSEIISQAGSDFGRATVHLSAETQGFVGPGGGMMELRGSDGRPHVRAFGSSGDLRLGGSGQGGNLLVFASDGDIGQRSEATVHIDGNRGDIVLRNADCAEEFQVAPGCEAEPGTVMVIDNDGRLAPSSRAYDSRVAGVVSGAGPLRPGIVLGRDAGDEGARLPIALAGRVMCRVDAEASPVEVGDLLTAGERSGSAMKAMDRKRAFGAVLGKALQPLDTGVDLVPILVALQ